MISEVYNILDGSNVATSGSILLHSDTSELVIPLRYYRQLVVNTTFATCLFMTTIARLSLIYWIAELDQ